MRAPAASRRACRSVWLVVLAAIAVVVSPAVPGAASRDPVRAKRGMVGSTCQFATRAGLDILRQGGNAVDAAVAVGFALAVTHPAAGNIGGGGFMTIRLADGKETVVEYREAAPARATRDMYLDATGQPVTEKSLVGPLAAGVPGSVAGLAYAQRKYGRLTLAQTVAPAIALARDGFAVSWALADSLVSARALFERFPATLKAFSRADGTPLEPGDRLVQPDLARTLSSIAAGGPEAFYRGPIAELLAAEMVRSGGLITKEDLAAYEPHERLPVTGTFRGYRIVAPPPPSSGGVALVQLLNILEAYPLAEHGHNSSRTLHLMAEAERRVFADRAEWLGDPAFFRVPVAGLVSRRYAATRRATIDPARATSSTQVRAGDARAFESSDTTHYSVVDGDGNAVSTTTTLNGWYGNGQLVPGAGFLLNNEMDDFSVKPGAPNMFGLVGGDANAIAPGKRMLSSMTPTIVVQNGQTRLVVGSPGGGRIITTVLQVVLNVLEHGMNVQQAVDAPRAHHQWQPDELRIERQGFPRDVVDALTAMGHAVRPGADMGDVHAIWVDPRTGLRHGASDPRADGRTEGF